jgi:PAS domain S-box-containing protein
MGYLDALRFESQRLKSQSAALPQESIDRWNRLAASTLRAPAALVSLCGAERPPTSEATVPQSLAELAALPHSACRVVATSGEPLRISDTERHPLFADRECATRAGVRAFMGVPLMTAAGQRAGSLCVFDHAPRDWTDAESQILTDLAAALVRELELSQPPAPQEDARFRSVFSEAALGMVIFDLAGRAIEINPALEQILGFTADEVSGVSISRLPCLDGAGEESELFEELLAGRREHFQLEKRFLSKEREIVSVNLTVSLLHDEHGSAYAALGIVEDVTMRHVVEAMREHRARLRALHELSVGVKHEINNVLATLQGNVELLAESKAICADERASVQAMETSIHRLAEAICRLDHVEDLPVVPYVGQERMVDLSRTTSEGAASH